MSRRTRESACRVASCAIAAALAAAGVACSGAGPDTGEMNVDALPRLILEEELRLGSVDDPDIGFSMIGQVDVDHDGRAYVLDMLDHEIRVYDPDGRELYRFGRQGEGPGEFQRPPRFGVVGDTVWTYEGFPQRITLFNRDGTVMSTGRVEGVPTVSRSSSETVPMVVPGMLREDGHFIGHLGLWLYRSESEGEPAAATDTVMIPRVRFELRRQDTGDGRFRWILLDPYGLPVGETELPNNRRIVWSDATTLWMVEPDEFDVPWLVRYRIVSQRG